MKIFLNFQNLKTKKIFVLSSINDKDVKENLFDLLSEKNNDEKLNFKYKLYTNIQIEEDIYYEEG